MAVVKMVTMGLVTMVVMDEGTLVILEEAETMDIVNRVWKSRIQAMAGVEAMTTVTMEEIETFGGGRGSKFGGGVINYNNYNKP